MTRRPQPTVVVALHDGFYGCGTGAGYANHALLRILTGLLPAQARLVVLPVRLDPASDEYDPAWHCETITLLNQVDALVHPVDNGTAGRIRFGGLAAPRSTPLTLDPGSSGAKPAPLAVSTGTRSARSPAAGPPTTTGRVGDQVISNRTPDAGASDGCTSVASAVPASSASTADRLVRLVRNMVADEQSSRPRPRPVAAPTRSPPARTVPINRSRSPVAGPS